MASTRSNNCLAVVGSGPGIGAHVAALFAARRFAKIALVARSAARLADDRVAVEAAAPASILVKTYAADITDLARLRDVMTHIDRDLGTVECLFFNAARVQPSALLEVDEEDMVYDFKIMCSSLHVVAKWAMPQLLHLSESDPHAKPSFIITSSLLPQQPDPDLFVLSMVKAAQRNMAESMAKVYGPRGVHVALVVVGGAVDPSNHKLNPKYIAERTWDLFYQPRQSQTFEVEILEA
ncbi:short chain dehydrogenase [Hirsutella rhossiliensis]|uniref:Short chain dehydrogenase domain-containing protein n=1 Tax=Hirsutella rhossiliensis TaxID=111463 RepID=A0A9P8N514_9HYPO|nr:short chain dehydrogenase domain-containing protein [Hirsutella rhossiliensis]KAH0966985.1 short chain dehydrogenase domain-containing protein [Hirsutella rhossiliensis]